MARAKKTGTSAGKAAAGPAGGAGASSTAIRRSAARSAVQETEEKVVEKVAQDTAPVLRKKALIEGAVLRSGQKKRDAKPVVEAVLAILGEALERGDQLNLPPFGKLNAGGRKTARRAHEPP